MISNYSQHRSVSYSKKEISHSQKIPDICRESIMHVYQGVCYALARERVDVLKDSSIRHVIDAFHKLLSLQMTND